MEIDLFLMFGNTKVEDVDDEDHEGRCYIREAYRHNDCVGKLLFPDAFEEDHEISTNGVPYDADIAISLFVNEGIHMLKERYKNYDDYIYVCKLEQWLRFLKFMKKMQNTLGRECRIFASVV